MEHPKRLRPTMNVRVLVTEKNLDTLEALARELVKLGKWKVRAKKSERDGYDQEYFFHLVKPNEEYTKKKVLHGRVKDFMEATN